MTDAIFYLLESSLLLILLYGLYFLALRKETLFQFNRYYLIAIPVIALLFPALRGFSVPEIIAGQQIDEVNRIRNTYFDALSEWEFGSYERIESITASTPTPEGAPGKMVLTVIAIAYVAGICTCFSRIAWTLRWISKTIRKHPVRNEAGLKIVSLPHPTAPFSFFNYVFVHEPGIGSEDFQLILAHERVHVQEKHSIDSLIVQLSAAILWFNPVMWQVNKSLKATHEYIADKKVLSSGYSAAAYQILLLSQLISNNSRELVHNFNLSFIKQRIAMMNNKNSGWAGKLKVILTLTISAFGCLAIVQCNSRLSDDDGAVTSQSIQSAKSANLPVLPASGFRFKGDLTNALTFTISHDRLLVNGQEVEPDQLSSVLDGTTGGRDTPVLIQADASQQMGLIQRVHMALRKLDRRKLLYAGITATGQPVEVMIVLPPDPEKVALPDPDELAAEGKIDLLTIRIGEDESSVSEEAVFNFVNKHISQNSQAYVVSLKGDDADAYGDYLLHTFHAREAFHRIYQERSRKLFGKDFFDTSEEEYQKVREGIPMSISIAEPN